MYPHIVVLVYNINTMYVLMCSLRNLNLNFYNISQITQHKVMSQLLVCPSCYVTHDIMTFPCDVELRARMNGM